MKFKYTRFIIIGAVLLAMMGALIFQLGMLTLNQGDTLSQKAADESKDQSYVLYSLTQDQLSRILFPLGRMTKHEAREIAEAQGFVNADKHDSQDICFVPDGDYANFIEKW